MSAWDDATDRYPDPALTDKGDQMMSPFPHRPVTVGNGDEEKAEPIDSQIARLADFILENYPDAIHNEGAVDTAIRLLGDRLTEPLPVFGVTLSDLRNWMADHHSQLQAGTLDKAAEYGALDLSIMGAAVAEVVPGIDGAILGVRLQAAIAFYLIGKCARVLSALAEGKPAPTDSWLDAEVYSMMGAYVQEYGRWP